MTEPSFVVVGRAPMCLPGRLRICDNRYVLPYRCLANRRRTANFPPFNGIVLHDARHWLGCTCIFIDGDFFIFLGHQVNHDGSPWAEDRTKFIPIRISSDSISPNQMVTLRKTTNKKYEQIIFATYRSNKRKAD